MNQELAKVRVKLNQVNQVSFNHFKFSVCHSVFSHPSALQTHYKAFRNKGRDCPVKLRATACFFCGFGPKDDDGFFKDRWRLAEHCLGVECRIEMKRLWETDDEEIVKSRYMLHVTIHKIFTTHKLFTLNSYLTIDTCFGSLQDETVASSRRT